MSTETSDGLRVVEGGTAVVAGGASGIGRALADDLAGRDCEVVLADLRISAEEFARRSLDGVARNKAIIVIPSSWRLAWWLNRLSPSLGVYLARKDHQSVLRSWG